MRLVKWCGLALIAACLNSVTLAEVKVSVESTQQGKGFDFKSVSPAALNDAATSATFTVIDGLPDANAASLGVLRDGKLPASEDQPSENFFFSAGTDGGLIEVDLGSTISVAQVSSYSWHANTRAAQVYKLYGADGQAESFTRDLKKGKDPSACGWKLIALVDSRSPQILGGRHGVTIAETDGTLGQFRYLLFDISPTAKTDRFGNTFYSEIDIVAADGPAPIAIVQPKSSEIRFTSADDKYQFSIDTTNAPDLTDWSDKQLRPVISAWYPKIVDLLPSENFEAPQRVLLRYLPDEKMRGIPAYASGATVTLNADWFRRELMREARGAVVHELVHVVQSYSGRNRRGTRVPGWVVEGIPDYVRWFLYEPESKGAEVTERNLGSVRYDASYRITGNFLDWLVRDYGQDIVVKLNAAARSGNYSEDFWKQATGKSEAELDEQWKAYHRQRIEKANASSK